MKLGQLQLMRRVWLATKQDGLSLVEAILAGSILALIVTALVGTFLYGQESTAFAGHRARAVFLAEEGLESVRNIRDDDFANLIDGIYGLTISDGQWEFLGSQDISDIFTRQIEISTVDSDTKQIITNVSWQQNPQRQGLVSLVTYFTNWAAEAGNQSDFLVVDTSQATLEGGNRRLESITLENTGSVDIIIDKINITWDNSNLIEEIKIDGTRVWSKNGPGTPTGKQPSGTEIDIQDYALVQGSGLIDFDRLKFDGDMSDSIFTIVFIMIDGSTKQATVDLSGEGGGGASDSLAVDITNVALDITDETKVIGMTIENTGISDIVIDKITVAWTGGPGGNKIQEIIINNNSVWSGKRNSGQELDISNFTLISGFGSYPIDAFKFKKDMTGTTLSVTFTMTDASTKTITGITP